jgi:hypothetical protein
VGEKQDGRSQVSSCVRVQLAKGIYRFIEYDVPRDIDPATGDIKTFKPFIKIAIPKKHTMLGAKLELVNIEWANILPACTLKRVHACLICFSLQKFLKGGIEVYDLGWKPIYDICGG